MHSILAVTVVYWKVFYDHDKDIARFIHTGDFLTAGITTDEPSLTLISPMIHDSGEYFCYARNDAGPTLSTAISLKVNGGMLINLFIKIDKIYTDICSNCTREIDNYICWNRGATCGAGSA